MLSKGTLLNTLVIFILFFLSKPVNAVQCTGAELSIQSASDVYKVTEKRCTKVIGDIRIQNIRFPQNIPSYWSIEVLHGSLIIENTYDLMDSLNFQNLRVIHSGDYPALVVMRNENLQLAIGARLKTITSKSPIKVLILKNGLAPIPANLLSTLHNAAQPDSSIVIDAAVEISKDSQIYFIFWSIFFGVACAILVAFLMIVAVFGRTQLKIHED